MLNQPDHDIDISIGTLEHILKESKFLEKNESLLGVSFNTQTGVRLSLRYENGKEGERVIGN